MLVAHNKITIIFGAGASKAYVKLPYPLLADLLLSILSCVDKLPGNGGRLRLYLAYALTAAHTLEGPDLANGLIPAAVIQRQFERVKALPPSDLLITTVFKKLEELDTQAGTRAYWALTHSIAAYRVLMAKADIDQSYVGRRDRTHARLIALIDKMLSAGITVNVVDFNYDCIVERERYSLGTPRPGGPRFGWDCGRERKVIADSEDTPLSELVENNPLQPPVDEPKYATWAGLIKPHGDMCTFLRGKTDVFYRGGRHSHTTTAIFPKRLADITTDDPFVRSSIMPPTNSRFRHMSTFYDQETQRLIAALSGCDTVVIIGWSASGTDNFYSDIFRNIVRDNSLGPRLYVINWSPDDGRDPELENKLQELFGIGATLQDVQMRGFSEAAVERIERCILRDYC